MIQNFGSIVLVKVCKKLKVLSSVMGYSSVPSHSLYAILYKHEKNLCSLVGDVFP